MQATDTHVQGSGLFSCLGLQLKALFCPRPAGCSREVGLGIEGVMA